MSVALTVEVNYSFRPDNEEWEAGMIPTLIQTYPGYYICTKCGEVLHESVVQKGVLRGPGDKPLDSCPKCKNVALPKEADFNKLEETEYCAGSICEVNSAVETVVLQLQRQVEQASEDLRVAEERAQAKREGKEVPDDDESAAQG